MQSWDQKIALITGAASGIGQACAAEWARAGASLVLVDRNAAGLRVAAAELAAITRVTAHVLDVTDASAVTHLVQDVDTTTRGLDVVINAAGILHTGPAWSASMADYAAQMAVNCGTAR